MKVLINHHNRNAVCANVATGIDRACEALHETQCRQVMASVAGDMVDAAIAVETILRLQAAIETMQAVMRRTERDMSTRQD